MEKYIFDQDNDLWYELHGDYYIPCLVLVTQLAEKEGINEQLKAQDQMAWVGSMNNIRNRVGETILQELIYGEDAV